MGVSKKYKNKTIKNKHFKRKTERKHTKINLKLGHEQKTNCSPAVENKSVQSGSCLTPEIIILLKNQYNKYYPTKQIHTTDPKELLKVLKMKFNEKGCKKELCMLEEIKDVELRENVKKEIFAPDQPIEWKTNPDEWLSNYDIMNVIRQYEEKYTDFKFFGPTTIDFDTRLPELNNQCVENNLCEFNLKKDLKNGFQHFACVFNLDKHYESGSHWVSIFVDIPEKIIFYFDSAASPIPEEISVLVKRLQKQSLELDKPFRFKYYSNGNLRHQNGGTECGMYALFFIITMLTGKTPFFKDRILSMKERIHLFTKKKIRDEVVFDYRDLYFNPREE
jgi:hypothetical protein